MASLVGRPVLEALPSLCYPCSRRQHCPRGPSTVSVTCCQSSKQPSVLSYFLVSDSARLDFGLGPDACPDVRVYLAPRLADGGNPTHLFRGLFSIARGFGSIIMPSTGFFLTSLCPIPNNFCRGHTEKFQNVVSKAFNRRKAYANRSAL